MLRSLCAATREEIQNKILSRHVPWDDLPEDADDVVKVRARALQRRAQRPCLVQDLLQKLLTYSPNNRLGANGAEEVMQHEFFDGSRACDAR